MKVKWSHGVSDHSLHSIPMIKILKMMMKTSQELRMLSSVTLDCQGTKIVMNSGSQLSELCLKSHKSLGLSELSEMVKVVQNC